MAVFLAFYLINLVFLQALLSVMLSKKKKERWEERQKKIEEQAKEIDDAMEVEVILAKEDVNKAVVQAWNSSEKLIPYVRTNF